MKKALLTSALILAAMTAGAQENQIEIVEDPATHTAMATFMVDKNGNRISGSYSGNVVVPDYSSSGYPVTTINHYTFEGCKQLTSVKIGNNVKFIDHDAFSNCSITDINIPASVDTIGSFAFHNMPNLKKVTLADGPNVLHFDYGELYGGRGMFGYNQQPNLEEAYVGRSFTCPDGVGLFFWSESLKRVTIGDAVTAIHPHDFGYCEVLESVTFGKGIKTIGEKAFRESPLLQSIRLNNGLTEIGNEAFSGCKGATTLTLPATLKLIGQSAFYNCDKVREVTIPASVDSIADGAFSEMDGLKKVTIADGTGILRFAYGQQYGGRGMFGYNQQVNLEEAYVGRSFTCPDGVGLFFSSESLKRVTIGDAVTAIHPHDFGYCEVLESVTFGKGIKTIGEKAFRESPLLQSIRLNNGLTEIGNEAFSGCKGATTLTLPATLKLIGQWAFYNCASVREVTIPESVDSIADGAFSAMEALKRVTIADGTTTLRFAIGESYGGRGMFGYNQQTALETAYVGRNFKSPVGLFRGSESLKTVFIGKNINQLHEQDFAYCDNLTSIYAKPSTPPVCAANTFDGVDKEACTVFTSQSSLNAYKQADVWKEFFNNIVVAPTSIQAIDSESSTPAQDIWFTTDGRRLQAAPAQPGLYIVNGYKVMIK